MSQTVTVGFVDQGYMGETTGHATTEHSIDLQIVKKP